MSNSVESLFFYQAGLKKTIMRNYVSRYIRQL